MPQLLSRTQIDSTAWDSCVRASSQRIVYGYSWYLDCVLPAPDWQWRGIVMVNQDGQYQAVMPVPLRRKSIGGLYHEWVVHQPFFCQFLAVFSANKSIDLQPFYDLLNQQFRYGSTYCTRQLPGSVQLVGATELRATHILDLSTDYYSLYQNYSRDRKLNLRRAAAAGWTVDHSTDSDRLLALFKEHHAGTIDGNVAPWAYTILRSLINELTSRGLVRLHYAARDGCIEAGALFVQEGNRIIYLFNAASPVGRRGNARTWMIDQLIKEKAGQPLIFDFESPAKPSIRLFYQSFGAEEELFVNLSWNRLNLVEDAFLALRRGFVRLALEKL